ncbi:MAG: cysteine desulfurase [Desulfotalea sp.]|nr:MAG: cysteine desulfurase [Desulfotalea sp.]
MIYLDNGATTWPKHRAMFAEMVERYMEIGVSPGRGSYDQAVEAQIYISKTREKLARFFGGADANRVIFTSNATDALNLALFGLLQQNSRVVTTRLEHNSVLRPLYQLQQTLGVKTNYVSFDTLGFVDLEEFEKAIAAVSSANNKVPNLAIVSHASNVLGTVQPLARIGDICRNYGVPLLVDASQSAGHIQVDMAAMAASALVFTGHKSLYAPPGIGGLILQPDLEIKSTRFGGTGIESKSMLHTQAFPERLEAGTHNLMGIIGLSLAVDDLVRQGLQVIHRQEMVLASKLYRGLQHIPGIELYGGATFMGENDGIKSSLEGCYQLPLFAANLKGLHPEDLSSILDGDFDIAVRSGLHCAPLVHETMGTGQKGAVRFSLGQFNTEAEIEQTILAMTHIAERWIPS